MAEPNFELPTQLKVLLTLPDSIARARAKLEMALDQRREAERALRECESRTLLGETGVTVTGVNQKERDARLYQLTHPERVLLEQAELELGRCKVEVGLQEDRFQALLTIAPFYLGALKTEEEG